MDRLIVVFNGSRDLSEKSAYFAEMLRAANKEPPRIDPLLAMRNDEGAAAAAIAFYNATKHATVINKYRFHRFLEISKSRNHVLASAAMDLLSSLLSSNKLDDFEKAALRQHTHHMSNARDIFGTMKTRWLSQIAYESNMIYRESFVAGIAGAFCANAYHHGVCDPNVRGMKAFLEIATGSGGAFSIKKFEEEMDSLVFLFGSPHASLRYAFIGFSHAKFESVYSSSLIRSLKSDADGAIAIANAVRFALRTADAPFDEPHFWECVAANLTDSAARQIRAGSKFIEGPIDRDVVYALCAFSRTPDNFEMTMRACEDSSVCATVAGMLVSCKTARACSNVAIWNGNNIYPQIYARAFEFFELANACKIFCA